MSSHVKHILFADDIGSNIEGSHAATAQGKSQLAKAAKTQRSNSSLVIYDAYPPPPPTFFRRTKWQMALTSMTMSPLLVYTCISEWGSECGCPPLEPLISSVNLQNFMFFFSIFWLIWFLFFCADVLALGDIRDCASHCSHSTCGLIGSSLIR